ncbi:MAG: hypothetical protein R3C19_22910 [Planctomycetaceae bacterium]
MGVNLFSADRKTCGAAILSLLMFGSATAPSVAQAPDEDPGPYTILGFDQPTDAIAKPIRQVAAKASAARASLKSSLVGRFRMSDAAMTAYQEEDAADSEKEAPPSDPFDDLGLDPMESNYSGAYANRAYGNCESPFAPNVQYNPCVPEGEEGAFGSLTEQFLEAIAAPSDHFAHGLENVLGSEHVEPHTHLNPNPIGLQPVPCRPPLLLEANEDFLGPGFLSQGICTPTGAIWRPALWVFGNFRTGVSYFDGGNGSNRRVLEWANRLDLFGQLNLSGTERLVLGIRPLDEDAGSGRKFTTVDLRNGDFTNALNGNIQTLFFEGDFGEIFPNLDPYDHGTLDYGFSVGRQPMLFQQGLLLNEDKIDAVTITKNTLNGNGNLNMRATFVYAWDQISRTVFNPASPADTFGNQVDSGARIVGLFTESDFEHYTVNADIGFVQDGGSVNDMIGVGLSGIRRIHGHHNTYNSSLHFLASLPTNGETTIAGQGELLFSQFSWTPHHSEDLIYLNGFWAIDQFTSLSRGPVNGGPLGQTGLLFSAAGLGGYGAPLSSTANNVVGASLGYQMFFDHTRQQVILELGGRQDTDNVNQAALAAGARYQKALDEHWFLVFDTFVAKREDRDASQGARVELQMKF